MATVKKLMTQAKNFGVAYLDETALGEVREETIGLRLSGTRRGKPVEIAAQSIKRSGLYFVLDFGAVFHQQ